MRMFNTHGTGRIIRLCFSSDAGTLSAACRNQVEVIDFYLADSGSYMWSNRWMTMPSNVAHSNDGNVVAVALGHAVLPYRRSWRDTQPDAPTPLRRYNFEPLAELPASVPMDRRRRPTEMLFSPPSEPGRTRLAVAGAELLLWNPHTQEYIVAPEEGDYRGVSFGPDGTTVTSIEYHAHALCVWNVKPFRVLFRTDLKGIDAFDNGSVAMMPDGERVIVAAGNTLRCVPIHGGAGWDTTTKKPPLEIALHPSGRMLLVADGSKKVTTYDTSNGKVSAQYDWGIGKVGCVTYSPDGTLAAAGGEKGQVVVWDAC
jgi:WD40 repeat protein